MLRLGIGQGRCVPRLALGERVGVRASGAGIQRIACSVASQQKNALNGLQAKLCKLQGQASALFGWQVTVAKVLDFNKSQS